jgi:predicted PurR-regulated permease PerM
VGFGQGLAKPPLSLGKGAISLLIAMVTIFVLVLLLLLEGPKLRAGLLNLMSPARAERYSRIAREVNRSVTGYMLGNILTSVIAGGVVLVTLLLLHVPFPFLWALWVGLVDFLPMIGGALAGIPTVLFAAGHSLTAGIITLVVFHVYTQIENHVLNPIVMSRTVRTTRRPPASAHISPARLRPRPHHPSVPSECAVRYGISVPNRASTRQYGGSAPVRPGPNRASTR